MHSINKMKLYLRVRPTIFGYQARTEVYVAAEQKNLHPLSTFVWAITVVVSFSLAAPKFVYACLCFQINRTFKLHFSCPISIKDVTRCSTTHDSPERFFRSGAWNIDVKQYPKIAGQCEPYSRLIDLPKESKNAKVTCHAAWFLNSRTVRPFNY